MNVQKYRQKRLELQQQEVRYRALCDVCRQPEFSCYCPYIQSFDPKIKFVILIHPIEVKRRIATGRMSHLCLQRSELIRGLSFGENARVNEILQNPEFHSVILYPGPKSLNLSEQTHSHSSKLFADSKQLVVFVIDGTWSTARKMLRQSANLMTLPQVCFTPPHLSRFRVRKQPAPECFSTIEAIHHTIELLGAQAGFSMKTRAHDAMLSVFDKMVHNQLQLIKKASALPEQFRRRRDKAG